MKKQSPEELAAELLANVANPAEFSDAELAALKEASISLVSPCAGPEPFTQIDNPPKALLSDTFMEIPRTYFEIFRNTRGVPVPPEVWPFVKEKWPVLAEKTDEELMLALGPMQAVTIDLRSVM